MIYIAVCLFAGTVDELLAILCCGFCVVMIREAEGLNLPQHTSLRGIMHVYPLVDLLRIIVSWYKEVNNTVDALLLIGMVTAILCVEKVKVELRDSAEELSKLK